MDIKFAFVTVHEFMISMLHNFMFIYILLNIFEMDTAGASGQDEGGCCHVAVHAPLPQVGQEMG